MERDPSASIALSMDGCWAASPRGSQPTSPLTVTYVRIAFAVLSILGGAGLPLYLAAWALIPEEGSDVAIAEGFFRHAGGATS